MQEYVSRNQKMLRRGFTTGTCAAAAAQAAARSLLLGQHPEKVTVRLPKGGTLDIPVREQDVPARPEASAEAVYGVRKESGDDPDVTAGTMILSRVKLLGREEPSARERGKIFRDDLYPDLYLGAGEGVGTVTKPGLEQRVGMPAVNRVPRRMIFDAVGGIAEAASYGGNILITVSVPEGAALAKKTFNPVLGIEGGISILGTSGIVEPMSEKALVDTIEVEVRQRAATGVTSILMAPGNYGKKYCRESLGLDASLAVETSNYIGESIDLAISYGMKELLLVGNCGKLVKIAAGIMNTHSHVADARGEIFASHAALAGASPELVREIMDSITTDQMIGCLDRTGIREEVMDSIFRRMDMHMGRRIRGQLRYGVFMFSEKYGLLGKAGEAEEILAHMKGN